MTARRLAVFACFAALLAVTVRASVDADTFWHLRAGQWMLDHGRVIRFDVFSHSAAGRPWIDHSWLSQIGMALVHRALGFAGLALATGVLVCIALYLVYSSDRSDTYLRLAITSLAAATTSIYWSARPHLLSLVFAAWFGRVLIDLRRHGTNRLWTLPLVMIAWANLHAGWAIGLLLLGATLAGETAEWALARLGGPRDEPDAPPLSRLAWLALTGLGCVAAVSINPYGFALLTVPFRTVSIGVLQSYIQEWQSPNFHMASARWFIALWLVTFGAVGASRRRLGITDFVLFATFTVLALLAARNLPLFAIVAAPIAMLHSGAWLERIRSRQAAAPERTGAPVSSALAAVLLLVVIAAAGSIAAPSLTPAASEAAIARTMPAGAAAWVRAHGTGGRLFNSYNFGGFLSWKLGDRWPVFVDGRTDLYDEALFNEYIGTYMASGAWTESLARRRIELVIVEPTAPIAEALLGRPEWELAWHDRVALVFVRRHA